jgi:hypothetical protein
MTKPNGTELAATDAATTSGEDSGTPAGASDYIDLTENESIRIPEALLDDGGDVARKPDEIVAEIEATRAELADTIDAIADRISPRRAAARGAQAVKAQVTAVRGRTDSAGDPDSHQDPAGPAGLPSRSPGAGQSTLPALLNDPKVVAVAGIVGAVIALLVLRRRR